MVFSYPPEFAEHFKHMNPDYRRGFEEGFNIAKNIISRNLREKADEYEILQAYTNVTTTVGLKRKKKTS